jgi:hypothetical protein
MTYIRIGIYLHELMDDQFQEVGHMSMTHDVKSNEDLLKHVNKQVKRFTGFFKMVTHEKGEDEDNAMEKLRDAWNTFLEKNDLDGDDGFLDREVDTAWRLLDRHFNESEE